MTEVLFPLKSEWKVIQSVSVIAIHASLLKNVETTFYETLKNCENIVMTYEHAPIEVLRDNFIFHVECYKLDELGRVTTKAGISYGFLGGQC